MLDGQAAIVTGGTKGIGRAVALKLASEGAGVVVNYSSDDEAALSLLAEAASRGCQISARKESVSDPSGVERLVEYAYDTYNRLDILVNNAGIKRDCFLITMPGADWDRVVEVDLKGVFLATKLAARKMIGRRSGKIINMTSLTGVAGMAGQANYAAAKGGIVAFTKSIALELGRFGISVNAIAPGFIETAMLSDVPEQILG